MFIYYVFQFFITIFSYYTLLSTYIYYIFLLTGCVETHVTFCLLFMNVFSQIGNLLFEVMVEFMLFLF